MCRRVLQNSCISKGARILWILGRGKVSHEAQKKKWILAIRMKVFAKLLLQVAKKL